MKKLLSLFVVAFFLMAGSAMAVPGGPPGGALQTVLDDITTAPVAGDSSVDVTTDFLADVADSHWSITGAGGSVTTLIIEIAAFAPNNKLGVYDLTNPAATAQIFAGAAAAGDQAVLSIKADGSVWVNFADTGVDFAGNAFGYYLDSTADVGGGFWYSDTGMNSDGYDHMYAYQGTNTDTVQLPGLAPGVWTDNEFVFAWEDLDGSGSDWDFTDMVVMVESVQPIVPEPASMLLIGGGLLGLAGIGRSRINRKK